MGVVLPVRHQPPLPDFLIRAEAPSPEAIELDVLIVGAGPAGLACAIALAKASPDLAIGVLEKAGALGEHSLSGAVINPSAMQALFPDMAPSEFPFRQPVAGEAVYYLTEGKATRIPTPPTMRNHGNWVASLSEVVRWLGERAEEAGVNIFPGFPAESLLVDGERVVGVRTVASGLDREGQPGASYSAPTDLVAKVMVLAEGSRGLLAQAWREWQRVGCANPQIFALGVKEIWESKRPLDRMIHTMGWPLPTDAFGGSGAIRWSRTSCRWAWSSGSTITMPPWTFTYRCSGSSCIPSFARSSGRHPARMGGQDDPGGWLLRHPRTTER